MENILRENLDRCNKCLLHNLECNVKDKSRGLGKLYGWHACEIKDIKLFFVGLNPSYNRFPLLEHAFGGPNYPHGTGKEFVDLLTRTRAINHCYVTNLVKCSTLSNKVSHEHMEACVEHLFREVELLNPKAIVTMGNDVDGFLSVKSPVPIIKIWHPNYVFSYNRNQLENYENKIREILDICN